MKRLPRRHLLARPALLVFVVVSALVVSLGLETRASASPALDTANRAFAEGHYTQAAEQYQALIEQQGYSAPALLDLGNAYLRGGKPVEAMLAYERARLLAPRDPAIAKNLAEARQAAGVGDAETLAYRLYHVLTANEWTWLATAGLWLGLAGACGAALFPRRRAWSVRAAAAGGLAGAISLVALVGASRDERAALALRAAPVLVSPFDGAQSSFSLPPGSEVEMRRVHDGYVLVSDRKGESGWVERASVAPLIPN